jgi:PAS domain S-box-containing protein
MSLDILMTITSHRDASQRVEYLICAGRDITERKHAEDELRTLLDAIPHFVWVMRSDGAAAYANQRWCDYTGMTLEQIQGDGWLELMHPDDRQRVQETWQTAVRTGIPYEVEHRIQHGSTEDYCWFLARGIPYRDAQGTILYWVGTCTDIDDQKRIEETLRQSQERASVLMNSNIIGINVIEGEQIVDANDTFLRMTGYTRDDLRAGRMNEMHMTPPEYLTRTQQAHQELATRQSMTSCEKEYVCKDGSRLPVVVGRVVLDHHPLQAIGFVLDNSAQKQLEQRKDAFISMASHELRTPLTVLKLQTTLLHRQLARQGIPDAAPAIADMEAQINAITRLVEELLDVSKIQAGRLEYRQERVDLDALLREIVDTMQHLYPSHRILMQGTVRASLVGDRDRLAQVFINLLSNAIKYSPDAQTVEMDLSASPETVTICVRDHGLGIPREQRDRIFERFYRVAAPQQGAISGLGMGLYIVAEIVKRHGGTISVDSEVGRGSTFTVTFPRMRDA